VEVEGRAEVGRRRAEIAEHPDGLGGGIGYWGMGNGMTGGILALGHFWDGWIWGLGDVGEGKGNGMRMFGD
jgi:hypothetical protein